MNPNKTKEGIKMDWFENVKGNVKKTTEKAMAKSNELLELTKLRFSISEAESELEELAQKLGEKVYNDYKAGAELSEEYLIFCHDLDNKNASLALLEEQLAKIKNVKKCERCGRENVLDANYCISCGEKLE